MLARRLFVFTALAGCLLMAAPSRGHAEDLQAAKDFVATLADKTLATMRATDLNDTQKIEQFHKLFIGSVDLPAIGKLVLARHWRTATDDQRAEFMKLFEDVVVLTWSARFKDAANDITLKVEGAKADVDDGILVESAILRGKQDPVSLVWRLRPKDGSYAVVDLKAEGTSMVFTYREEYASAINQHGGQLDGLLDDLRKLVARLQQQPQAQAVKAG